MTRSLSRYIHVVDDSSTLTHTHAQTLCNDENNTFLQECDMGDVAVLVV